LSSSWSVNNLELADASTLHIRWQGKDMCSAVSANLLTLSLYRRLAAGLLLEHFASQALTDELYMIRQHHCS